MDTPPPATPNLPDRLNGFMTTEHFTLQAARGIVNGEIVSRINIYFTTLSSVLIATAFLAQRPELSQFFQLKLELAFVSFPSVCVTFEKCLASCGDDPYQGAS